MIRPYTYYLLKKWGRALENTNPELALPTHCPSCKVYTDRTTRPAIHVDTDDPVEMIGGCIAKLPTGQQQALRGRYVKRWSDREVARWMRCNKREFRRHLTDAETKIDLKINEK